MQEEMKTNANDNSMVLSMSVQMLVPLRGAKPGGSDDEMGT